MTPYLKVPTGPDAIAAEAKLRRIRRRSWLDLKFPQQPPPSSTATTEPTETTNPMSNTTTIETQRAKGEARVPCDICGKDYKNKETARVHRHRDHRGAKTLERMAKARKADGPDKKVALASATVMHGVEMELKPVGGPATLAQQPSGGSLTEKDRTFLKGLLRRMVVANSEYVAITQQDRLGAAVAFVRLGGEA